jgi:hypothetical protein
MESRKQEIDIIDLYNKVLQMKKEGKKVKILDLLMAVQIEASIKGYKWK